MADESFGGNEQDNVAEAAPALDEVNNTTDTPEVETATNGTDETPKPSIRVRRKLSKKQRIMFGVVGAVVLLGAIAFIFKDPLMGLLWSKAPEQAQSQTEKEKAPLTNKSDSSDPEIAKFIKPTTGETWLDAPKSMSPQGWLKVESLSFYQDDSTFNGQTQTAEEQLESAKPTYVEVGERDGNRIILVTSPTEGFAGMWYLFELYPDGKVAVIVKPQTTGSYTGEEVASYKSSMTDEVTLFDETTRYDSISIPSKIAIDDGEYVLRPEYVWIADPFMSFDMTESTATLARQLGDSSLYRREVQYADTNLTNIVYYLELPIGTKIGLRYEPHQPSLSGYTFDNGVSMQYSDSTGKMVYDDLLAIARGCGSNYGATTRSDIVKDIDLVQVGKTNTGVAVYELKNKEAALYKKAYEEYKQFYDKQVVSFDEYVKNHGLVIIKNAKGEFLVYVRAQYAIVGGCAKPVVYLYPTSPTLVSVRVGADVTVSDPLYPKEGWQNVLAQPNGELTYNGAQYESLFWEGNGHGSYPGITAGTVVARSAAAATIRAQLTAQSLNNKEISDFMEFWESKIPSKPFVRLTWLTQSQLDALAPLKISPKPDTVIRVFLDMDGYDAPIRLPAQKLQPTVRKGFTVVEWGGLTSEIRH